MFAEITSTLRQQALHLSPGETKAGLMCPRCRGGKSSERTMSLTRQENGVVLYCCHRAKCTLQGGFTLLQLSGPSEEYKSRRDEDSPNLLKPRYKEPALDLVKIEGDNLEFLKNKFHLTESEILRAEWKWDKTSNRLHMPMQGIWRAIGYVLRSFDRTVKPKVLNVQTSTWCQAYSVYRTPGRFIGHKYLIVEDQISALRASYKINSLALLGTNLGEDLVTRLKGVDLTDAVICLDADAFQKALKLQKDLSVLFKSLIVVKPPKDLKNMDRDELDTFLNDIIREKTNS
jgi:hypothetical protein